MVPPRYTGSRQRQGHGVCGRAVGSASWAAASAPEGLVCGLLRATPNSQYQDNIQRNQRRNKVASNRHGERSMVSELVVFAMNYKE